MNLKKILRNEIFTEKRGGPEIRTIPGATPKRIPLSFLIVFLGLFFFSGCIKNNAPPFPVFALPPGTSFHLSQPVPVVASGQKIPRSLRYIGTLDAIASPSDGRFVVVGDQSSIWKSDDGGVSWKRITPPLMGDFYGIAFSSALVGWISGDDGVLLKTVDGGDHWTRVPGPVKEFFLQSSSFPDPLHGFISGEKGIVLATSDGGASWRRLVVPTVQNLYGIAFLTPLHGYIAGWHRTFLETTDGGVTFHRLEMVSERVTRQVPSFNVLSTDGKRVLLAGDHGLAYYSPDGDSTHFSKLEIPVRNDLYGAALLPDGSVALSGEGGILLSGKPGGAIEPVIKTEGDLSESDFLGLISSNGKLSVVGTLGVILTPAR
jgi:hypothetical protein